MATTFDELLLDKYYSDIAEGGPEWATDVQRSGLGGSVSVRNQNREDYIARYEIAYQNVIATKRTELRNFFVLRWGMARGFRFHAHDNYTLTDEVTGRYNSTSGNIEQLVTTNGTDTKFYVIRHYEDAYNEYTRWLVKPSPYANVVIKIFNAPEDTSPAITGTITAVAEGASIPDGSSVSLGALGSATFYFKYGILEFASAPASGKVIKITCEYHLPSAFATDWGKSQINKDIRYANFSLPIEELLPAEIGFTPDMTLPPLVSYSFSGSDVTFTWTDPGSATSYEYEIAAPEA